MLNPHEHLTLTALCSGSTLKIEQNFAAFICQFFQKCQKTSKPVMSNTLFFGKEAWKMTLEYTNFL